jgi:hypothetical protein
MENQAKFDAQLDVELESLEGGPITLPDDLLKHVSGGIMIKPPFCQFLQYEAFNQVIG